MLTEKPTPSQFFLHLRLEFLTFKAHLHLIIYDVLFPFSYVWGERVGGESPIHDI